jgi:hypothetical protein
MLFSQSKATKYFRLENRFIKKDLGSMGIFQRTAKSKGSILKNLHLANKKLLRRNFPALPVWQRIRAGTYFVIPCT